MILTLIYILLSVAVIVKIQLMILWALVQTPLSASHTNPCLIDIQLNKRNNNLMINYKNNKNIYKKWVHSLEHKAPCNQIVVSLNNTKI
jgi:hypothetical protein